MLEVGARFNLSEVCYRVPIAVSNTDRTFETCCRYRFPRSACRCAVTPSFSTPRSGSRICVYFVRATLVHAGWGIQSPRTLKLVPLRRVLRSVLDSVLKHVEVALRGFKLLGGDASSPSHKGVWIPRSQFKAVSRCISLL